MAGPYLYLGAHLTELRIMLTMNKSNLYGCVWGHCALVVSGSCTKLLALDDHNVTHALHVHVTHHLDAGRVVPLRMFDVHVYCLYCCLPAYVVCGCYDWGGGGSVWHCACLLVFCLKILTRQRSFRISHNGGSILSLYMCMTAASCLQPH